MSVPVQIFIGTPLQIDQLLYDLLFAGIRYAKAGCISVGLFVLAKMIKAAIALACPRCRSGIDLVQIAHHFGSRSIQTIEVEAIESGLMNGIGSGVVGP